MADDGKSAAMRIDTKLVRELAKLLDENGLSEIEVEDGGRKIKVARNVSGSVGGNLSAAQLAAFGTMRDPAAGTAAAPTEAPAKAGATDMPDGTVVKSPMVGTAFLSPEPGAKPFASVGDQVKAGDTILIIEAMKVMNPITAPTTGTIKRLMVSDAQPVEFDQPLAVIG